MQLVALLATLVIVVVLAARFSSGPSLPGTAPRAKPTEILNQVQRNVDAANQAERKRADAVMGRQP